MDAVWIALFSVLGGLVLLTIVTLTYVNVAGRRIKNQVKEGTYITKSMKVDMKEKGMNKKEYRNMIREEQAKDADGTNPADKANSNYQNELRNIK